MGDKDEFFLDSAARNLHAFLQSTKDPVSDAHFIFSPMEGHCDRGGMQEVLLLIQQQMDRADK